MRANDELTKTHKALVEGSYDCVDRVVLNAYMPICHSPGGFRSWWRAWHKGSDAQLDDAHLIPLAGRFARRVRAWGLANGVVVKECAADERKHLVAEDYLANHDVGPGVFMVLVAKAVAPTWKVTRSKSRVLVNLEKKNSFVKHYSSHIMDPEWGHMVIKMSGHPPFSAQVILNGHNWVERKAQRSGVGFQKEGNCFTRVDDPARLARCAEALSRPAAIGRLRQVCERWIYSSVLCFALTTAEQAEALCRFEYSVYQADYSRNLLFADGAEMDEVFNRVCDRARGRLDVPRLKTLFGAKHRPHKDRKKPATLSAVVETPSYDLTWFKLTFGRLGLKAYTKGERVLRVEATCHNAAELGCGRVLERLPDIVGRLGQMADRFCTTLDCASVGSIPDGVLEELPRPSVLGAVRVGGITLDSARTRRAMAAIAALAAAPKGFTVAELAAKVHHLTGQGPETYTVRQAAYDLRKFRAKHLVEKPGRTRRYHVPPEALRTITAVTTIRDRVLAPLLGEVRRPRRALSRKNWTPVEHDYEKLSSGMEDLFRHLGVATAA